MASYQFRQSVYRHLKPWADRLYLWLHADSGAPAATSGSPGVPSVREIKTLAELDAELAEVDKAFAQSDDAGRARLASWRYAPGGRFPQDPYSPEYAQAQMDQYLAISGRTSYDPVVNEHSDFDLAVAKRAPFPYFTHSPATVGQQLILQGLLIQSLDLPPGATIAEFGPGWGGTTLHLALMGYRVTAVEIERNFVDLIRHRAAQAEVAIDVVQSDMLTFQPAQAFDCALFFESFHHCADHLQLLRNLEQIVKPDGLLVFGAEPIGDYPHPWGFVRTDGLTTWSIRKQGWFELGFNTSYFLRTLLYFGWVPRLAVSDDRLATAVFTARRFSGRYLVDQITVPPDEAAGWHAPEAGFRHTRGRAILSCARYRPVRAVAVRVRNHSPAVMPVTLEAGPARHTTPVAANGGEATLTLDVQDWQGQITIASPTWQPHQAYGNGDRRELGVAVLWVDLLE